jgi:hypothetical protein
LSGDEDDRYLLPAILQFLLKLRPTHSRHCDVENQASSLINAIGREEFFRRRERSDRKAELSQQVG